MPKTTLIDRGNGRDRICKHLRHFEKEDYFGVEHKTFLLK